MSHLPQVSGAEFVSALTKIGFYYVRRSKGTHLYIRRDKPFQQLAVPDHKTLKPGTLRSLIRQAGLSVDDFLELL